MKNLSVKMLCVFVILCFLSLTMATLCLATETGTGSQNQGQSEEYKGDVENLPWTKPVNIIKAALTGPIAKAVSTIAIVVAGLGMSFGEGQQRKLFKVVFGVAIAMGAGILIQNMFSNSGGLGF
ncbi:MAG TPA: TrbC/VirB2 family protein [Bacillota bacterium]|nr:TrbC/VirB2 family protein [Bacillota bacterium]HOL09911.1 TrbC/VirB2 family protein [Bacillota bacterium]HPO98133.1 TrbC/VirB2 family protein [Bacillota bacterium]